MNVSHITTETKADRIPAQGGFKQRAQDFKALDSALQSGDLAAAQDAMKTFQEHVQQKPGVGHGRNLFGRNSQGGKDFQAIQSALESGDLEAAQQAMATLKTDIQSARYVHPRHDQTPTDATPTSDTPTPTPVPVPAPDPAPVQVPDSTAVPTSESPGPETLDVMA